ncbi:hypothetical protein EKO27_g3218 [Xylaria grammica]|uniref:Radical SAM core domain-containing protein n=1 Tax=Xylaria grammica TaxID=363999 RepID=A0A439DBY0_9PEZI|nr:hypothetical protein EKO27_g3218 [Xylaria grammica]
MISLASRRLRFLRGRVKTLSTGFSPLHTTRNTSSTQSPIIPKYPIVSDIPAETSQFPFGFDLEEPEIWREVPPFSDVSYDEFLSWRWHTKIQNLVETKEQLSEFLYAVLPEEVPRPAGMAGMQTRDEFTGDVYSGIRKSAMSVRVMPYVLSRINWADPANCPIFRQFIPLGSIMVQDHPRVKPDSLHEQEDSPVDGIVHRYPDKALFLTVGVCPVYCVFCTRSYGVGANTEVLAKEPFKVSRTRFENAFAYVESQPDLKDIAISGGDAFYLPHHVLEWIGDRLIGMKNIERIRFATKGLAVAPNRFLDSSDPWTETLIRVSDKARRAGKLRNQSVLLRGVNDNVATMSSLIQKLAQMTIQPYYVYQCDMVPKVEHLRTPLQTILDLESELRGSIAGFYMPNFIVDLPEGGGKRLACSFESYDRDTGVSTFRAPVLTSKRKAGKIYKYYDPLPPSS